MCVKGASHHLLQPLAGGAHVAVLRPVVERRAVDDQKNDEEASTDFHDGVQTQHRGMRQEVKSPFRIRPEWVMRKGPESEDKESHQALGWLQSGGLRRLNHCRRNQDVHCVWCQDGMHRQNVGIEACEPVF